jgi:hypothetical protein
MKFPFILSLEFFFFFLVDTGFELGALLAWQGFHHFFCFTYFPNRVLCLSAILPLCLLGSRDDRCAQPRPACKLRWGLLAVLPGWRGTGILLISVPRAAGVTGMSHCPRLTQ